MKKQHKNLFKIIGLLTTIPVTSLIITACVNNKDERFLIETHNASVIQEDNSSYYIILKTFKTTSLTKKEIRDLEADVLVQTLDKVTKTSLKQSVFYDQANKYLKIKLPQRPLSNDTLTISFNNKLLPIISFNLESKHLVNLKSEKIKFDFNTDKENLVIKNTKAKLIFDSTKKFAYDYTIEVHLNELNDDGSIRNTNPIKSSKTKLSNKEVEFSNLNPNSKYKIVNVEFFVSDNKDNYQYVNDFIPDLEKTKIISIDPVKMTNYNLELNSNQQKLVYRDQKFELKYKVPNLKDKYVTFEIKEWNKEKNEFVDSSKSYESLRNDIIENKTKFINLKYDTTYKLTKINVYDQSGYANTSYDTSINLPTDDVYLITPKQDITFNIPQNNSSFTLKDKKLEINYELNINVKNIEIELVELDENNNVIDENNRIKSEITEISTKKAIFSNLKSNTKYKISNVFIYDSKTDKKPNASFNVLIPNIQNILITPEIPQEEPKNNTENNKPDETKPNENSGASNARSN